MRTHEHLSIMHWSFLNYVESCLRFKIISNNDDAKYTTTCNSNWQINIDHGTFDPQTRKTEAPIVFFLLATT